METFREWVKSREPGPVMPQADRVWQQIRDAGRRRGISRCQLGAAIDLEPETLDSVIQALVDFGRVVVSMQGDERIYRPS